MPGQAARSAQELPPDDGAAADSARYGQKEEVAAPAGPKAVFTPGRRLSIVQRQGRAVEAISQARGEREVGRNGQGCRIDGCPAPIVDEPGHGSCDTAVASTPVPCAVG